MTLSEDFNFSESGEEFAESKPGFTLFGIAFTPLIIGIIIGVLGVIGSGYMVFSLVLPTLDTYNQQKAKSTDLDGQIQQKRINVRQIDKVKTELAQAKVQQTQVLSLFAKETSLDTLLLDINRQIESSNAQKSINGLVAQLQTFVPSTTGKPEIITDGSLGAAVNNKLKRFSINVKITGNFEKTQSIIRNIERLQPLLIAKDFRVSSQEITPPVNNVNKNILVQDLPKQIQITTEFQLQALMPLSPEDAAQLAKAAKPVKK